MMVMHHLRYCLHSCYHYDCSDCVDAHSRLQFTEFMLPIMVKIAFSLKIEFLCPEPFISVER